MKQDLIALDIDDVLADLTEAIRQRVNELTGGMLEPADYRVSSDYFGYYERVWANHEPTKSQQAAPLFAEMVEDQLHVPLLAGAAYGLQQLSKRFQLIFITARPPAMRQATEAWFAAYLPEVRPRLHFMGITSERHNGATKGELCQQLGASYLIDDNVKNCQSALDQGVKAILFGEYGWQSAATEAMVRCKDWPGVIDYFNEI